ncbi:MAG: hypothetical protein ACRDMZ_07590, partial [Solirubrobacteraceae bacterium]
MRFARFAALFSLVLAWVALARDGAADGKWSTRRSSHFELHQDVGLARYSGPDGSRAFETAILSTLEAAHTRVRDGIGVEPRNRVQVFVYDPAVFDGAFSGRFGFRAAGFWDGAIQVRGGTQVSAELVGTLSHEYVHAALGSLAPPEIWPAWLNEGLAEVYERAALGSVQLTARDDAELRGAVARGAWIPLANLGGPSFSRLGQADAQLAYLESFATAEHMLRRYGREKVERLVEE